MNTPENEHVSPISRVIFQPAILGYWSAIKKTCFHVRYMNDTSPMGAVFLVIMLHSLENSLSRPGP